MKIQLTVSDTSCAQGFTASDGQKFLFPGQDFKPDHDQYKVMLCPEVYEGPEIRDEIDCGDGGGGGGGCNFTISPYPWVDVGAGEYQSGFTNNGPDSIAVNAPSCVPVGAITSIEPMPPVMINAGESMIYTIIPNADTEIQGVNIPTSCGDLFHPFEDPSEHCPCAELIQQNLGMETFPGPGWSRVRSVVRVTNLGCMGMTWAAAFDESYPMQPVISVNPASGFLPSGGSADLEIIFLEWPGAVNFWFNTLECGQIGIAANTVTVPTCSDPSIVHLSAEYDGVVADWKGYVRVTNVGSMAMTWTATPYVNEWAYPIVVSIEPDSGHLNTGEFVDLELFYNATPPDVVPFNFTTEECGNFIGGVETLY